MGSITGTVMDPTPYFLMAYGAGAVGLLGFALWNLLLRRRLRAQLAAIKPTQH